MQRGVAVIPRSQNPKNIKANIEGIFDWVLPREAKVPSPVYENEFVAGQHVNLACLAMQKCLSSCSGLDGKFSLPVLPVSMQTMQVHSVWTIIDYSQSVDTVPQIFKRSSIPPHLCLFSPWDTCMQAKLDTLDSGFRTVDPDWHDWGDVEEGGASKHSKVLA